MAHKRFTIVLLLYDAVTEYNVYYVKIITKSIYGCDKSQINLFSKLNNQYFYDKTYLATDTLSLISSSNYSLVLISNGFMQLTNTEPGSMLHRSLLREIPWLENLESRR
ncbi:hypothetical protein M0802_004638 [Mischocyttarus mexicanus]|nr:hypothetical protein M0802_004638 [Mischocyttarus mexicanus]